MVVTHGRRRWPFAGPIFWPKMSRKKNKQKNKHTSLISNLTLKQFDPYAMRGNIQT
jgi:hypothetical protein